MESMIFFLHVWFIMDIGLPVCVCVTLEASSKGEPNDHYDDDT